MKRLIIFISVVFYLKNSYGQDTIQKQAVKNPLEAIRGVPHLVEYKSEEQKAIDSFIYDKVYKNIIAHNIRFASHRHNGISFNPLPTYGESSFFYEALFPEPGYKLQMKIERSEMKYPKSEFIVYKITLVDGLSFRNDSIGETISSPYVNTEKYFLIGLNPSRKEIKFISGQFFNSLISEDFKVNYKDPSSFYEYLNFRLFRYQVKDIKLTKKKRKELIYSGYSEYLKRTVRITVLPNEIDEVRILALKK